MALLSTGNPKLSEKSRGGRVQQEKCQGELSNPIPEALNILCNVDHHHAPLNFQPRENLDGNFVSLEEGLKLLDGAYCPDLGSVSPFSDYSSDSGVIGGSVFIDDQQFLAGLSDLLDDTSSCVPERSLSRPCSNHLTASSAKTAEVSTDRSRKNAEAARQNRIKKKKYMEELEKDRSTLETENVVLKTRCREYQTKCQVLKAEVEYLKNVLANDSSLASLIKNIPRVPNIKLTSSFLSRKRSSPGVNIPETSKKSKTVNRGVCLHVSNDIVSLEFCNKCSMAAQS